MNKIIEKKIEELLEPIKLKGMSFEYIPIELVSNLMKTIASFAEDTLMEKLSKEKVDMEPLQVNHGKVSHPMDEPCIDCFEIS